MRSCTIILAFCFLFGACQDKPSPQTNPTEHSDSPNKVFEEWKNTFVESLWAQYPDWGVSNGYYKHAAVLKIPNQAERDASKAFIDKNLEELKAIDTAGLSVENATDWLMVRDQLKASQWYLSSFLDYQWNPANYNVADALSLILSAEYAPLPQRLADIGSKMALIPDYFRAAQANINTPTKEHTELAILQNKGALGVFDNITDSLKTKGIDEEKRQQWTAQIDSCKKAINGYVSFLEQLLEKGKKDPKAFRDFRIGKETFAQKFAHDINSGFSAEDMYQKALLHKQDLHKEMVRLSREIWAKYMGNTPQPKDSLKMVKALIEKIAQKHVKPEEFVSAIKKQIPELTEFVNKHNLLRLDPTKPLEVRETPEYMRGVAGASISAPGPYDKDAPTFYNVTPLDGYTPERAESYLREYNHYILQILNIHEAIPGHYAQLVYSNQSPSIIKSVLGNGAMVEGWAVYTERMMLEEGYGNNEPEMWLMYYKWNLRVSCNTIIDYGIHAMGMSKEEVMHILQDEAFQEAAEAAEKWRRATLSQVQLCSYFSGFKEIYEFRETLKKEQGKEFDLRSFHERFLSYGSAPIKYVKQMMAQK